MLEIASQIIICLILAALLGFIIGYLLGKSTCAGDEPCGTTALATETNDVAHISTPVVAQTITKKETEIKEANNEPLLLSEPRNGKKDNLTRIKGIGLKIDQTLNDLGIYHFDQIASWSDEEAAWVDAQTAFPGRVQRENWVDQAKALSVGEETEFSKRVDKGEVSSSKKA